MIGLTSRQLDMLRFIAGHAEARGTPPTYTQAAEGMGLCSNSGVHRLIHGLIERGHLRQRIEPLPEYPYRRRTVEVLTDIPVPRAPDGAPLYFVGIDG